jgi:hypothetical protein
MLGQTSLTMFTKLFLSARGCRTSQLLPRHETRAPDAGATGSFEEPQSESPSLFLDMESQLG